MADSSVFPSNTGVNPQIPIMAVATLCARRVLGRAPDEAVPIAIGTTGTEGAGDRAAGAPAAPPRGGER